MARVFDGQGRALDLGRELGRGGEGAVFEIRDQPRLVAKVYHQAVDPAHAAKLKDMASLRTERLLRVAAWPTEILSDRRGGRVVGLLMPRISGRKQIHELYGPRSRLAAFPHATWPFLVHAAANLARSFAVVHEHGHVVGDVNERNIVVSDKATVVLIDCDSFQVTANGRRYLCQVGVPTHQPPEMQILPSFRGVVRTPNHDNFGLAVLVFQLLVLGRHPFSGRYLGPGEMTIERAIKEYRFAYGAPAAARQMRQPPNTLALAALSAPIVTLFERAFSQQGSQPRGRPTAAEWVSALDGLLRQVRQCRRNPAHVFLSSLVVCPWCEIEGKTGLVLFVAVATVTARQATFDLPTVWATITAVPAPSPAPPLKGYTLLKVAPSPSARAAGIRRRARNGAAIIIVVAAVLAFTNGIFAAAGFWVLVASFVVAYVLARFSSSARDEAKRKLAAERQRWDVLSVRWQREAGDGIFREKLAQLEQAQRELAALPAKRTRKLEHLRAQRRERQLNRYLEGHHLATARISGIGPGRAATLRSFGIETAADINHRTIISIPGFGPNLTGNLVGWRRKIETGFVFNPAKGDDPRDIAAIENEFKSARQRLEQELSSGPASLRKLAQEATLMRQTLLPEIESAARALAQAEADWRAM